MVKVQTNIPREIIDKFLRQKELYRDGFDDLLPEPDRISFVRELESEHLIDFGLFFGEQMLMIVLFRPLNSICAEIWVAALPICRGRIVKQFMLEVMNDLFLKTQIRKIVAKIPEDHRASIGMARATGFHLEGRITRAVLHGGALRDYLIYGVNAS